MIRKYGLGLFNFEVTGVIVNPFSSVFTGWRFSGRFISPKIRQKYKINFDDMWKKSLVKSIDRFISKIKKNNKTDYKILTQHMNAISPALTLR